MATRRLSILLSHLRRNSPIHSSSNHPPGSLDLLHLSSDLRAPRIQKVEKPISNNDDKTSKLPVSENSDEEKSCIFCMIVRGESPALKLYEDDICLCILDTSPLTNGHSLIIPKSHFRSLEATPPSVVAAMCSVVPLLSNAIMKATHCDSFNLVVNNGAAAGQVIFHTHLHVIPRKIHDHLWTSESFRRRRLNEDTSLLADGIRRLLSQASEKCSGCKIGQSKPCLTASDACACAGTSHGSPER